MQIKKNMFFEKPPQPVENSYKADFYVREIIPHLPSAADLAMMIENDHYDVASLVMYRSLKQSNLFSKFISTFDHYQKTTQNLSKPTKAFILCAEDYFGEGGPEVKLLELIHMVEDAGLVPIPVMVKKSNSISANALELDRTLREELDSNSILVTFGSQSLTARMWLEKKGSQNAHSNKQTSVISDRLTPSLVRKHLKGWLMISGSLRGSSLAESQLKSPLNAQLIKWTAKLKGYSFEGLIEQRETYPIWRPVFLNSSEFSVVSLMGVPKFNEIHPRLRSQAARLSSHGPSDGVNLLSHMIPQRGYVYPVLGADYFMNRVDRKHLIKKALCLLTDLTLKKLNL